MSVVPASRQTTNSFFGEFSPLYSLYPNILSDFGVALILWLATAVRQESERLGCDYPAIELFSSRFYV